MSTILFNDMVFGPIKSRRLGNSLGLNLAPVYGKICNFDCIYCECGFNKDGLKDSRIPAKEEVMSALENRLKNYSGDKIDSITFSGNGEPTMHPDFYEIIAETVRLRDIYASGTKISVLTNGTRIEKPEIARALAEVDNAIIKIDSAVNKTAELINRPQIGYSIDKTVAALDRFKGKFVLQTMFLKGEFEGRIVDNTLPAELEAWYSVVKRSCPRLIMMYTIDRETPVRRIEKISLTEMEKISQPLKEAGFKIIISG